MNLFCLKIYMLSMKLYKVQTHLTNDFWLEYINKAI